jgi:HAD superfamily hydrolase (TIGR01509 family)
LEIRNIIFDLGGVLLNLDFSKTTNAFTSLGVKDFENYFGQYHANPLFKKLETGDVEENFYEELRKQASITADNHAINEAWNAMLLDFPADRIDRLKHLGEKYRLFLFSNTNAIHHAAFHSNFQLKFGFDFDELFEKAYYSHLIGYRKPDPEAFEFVISDSALQKETTLFLDDTLPNVKAAELVGLKAALVTPEKGLLRVLEEQLL